MQTLDQLAVLLVVLLIQTPLIFILFQRDKEIHRLNTALLRVERPVAAAVAERPVDRPEPEPETDEQRAQRRARQNMFKV